MIVDEHLTDLEMKHDPFGDDVPPSELPYREDKECPSIYKKSKIRFYRSILIRSHFKQDVEVKKPVRIQFCHRTLKTDDI